MATVGTDISGGMNQSATALAARRPLFPEIRWGAVLAGVAVGIAVQLVLTLLGVATGLSTTNLAAGETVGWGPLLWAGLSMLIAAFVGGYVAARMSGFKRRMDGILHGAVAWGVTTLLFATLLGGSLLNAALPAASMDITRSASMESPVAAMLRGQIERIDPDALQRLQQHLRAGQRDQAIGVVTSLGVEQGRAATIVDQALILTGQPDSASPQGRQTANRAVGVAGATAWVAFFAVALALAIGISGGILGASGSSRRGHWTGSTAAAR